MIKAIVTDIEGTTSSLSFVKDVLFPYAREHLGEYLDSHAEERAVIEQIEAIKRNSDGRLGNDATLEEVVDLLKQWIDEDRKTTSLKTLQGWVWEQGYSQGDFHGHVYQDAFNVLQQWHQQGVLLYVYSSGSVHAQRLLFGHSVFGDMTTLFSGYFDTQIGPKGDTASYQKISNRIDIAPNDILFLSDIVAELNAAQLAGMQTWHLIREDNEPVNDNHRQARNFEDIAL